MVTQTLEAAARALPSAPFPLQSESLVLLDSFSLTTAH